MAATFTVQTRDDHSESTPIGKVAKVLFLTVDS